MEGLVHLSHSSFASPPASSVLQVTTGSSPSTSRVNGAYSCMRFLSLNLELRDSKGTSHSALTLVLTSASSKSGETPPNNTCLSGPTYTERNAQPSNISASYHQPEPIISTTGLDRVDHRTQTMSTRIYLHPQRYTTAHHQADTNMHLPRPRSLQHVLPLLLLLQTPSLRPRLVDAVTGVRVNKSTSRR